MARPHTRTIKARRLGIYLRKLRESYGLEIREVAESTRISYATIRRLEQGLHQTELAVLEKLLDTYQVAYEHRMELLELAGEAFRSGWWLEYGDVLHDVYAALEDEADRVLSYQAQVIPGLLQTDAYARGLFSATLAPQPDDIERRVRARRERRAILERSNPPLLHAVLLEGVLRQQVGGPDVMAAQIEHLVMMGRRGNVTIQVLPYHKGAHAGMSGPFMIFEFEHPDDPDIVHTENLSGSAYSESKGAVDRFKLAWGSVTDAALPHGESADFLAALTRER